MAGDAFEMFGSGFNNLIQGTETLVGTTGRESGQSEGQSSTVAKSKGTIKGISSDRLEISDEAIQKIISDTLSGPDGLAEIFAGEQNAGIFDSSVAAQAAGDLTSKVVGEIAKLRAKRIQTQKQTSDQEQTQDTTQSVQESSKTTKDGLLESIFGGF